MIRWRRAWRIIAVAVGAPIALVAFIWFVPFSPAMIHPLYWQLVDVLAKAELIDLAEKDVTAKVCPLADRNNIGQVAEHRSYPADGEHQTGEFWLLREPKSPARVCRDHRLRILSIQFDDETGACSAHADTIPQCDF